MNVTYTYFERRIVDEYTWYRQRKDKVDKGMIAMFLVRKIVISRVQKALFCLAIITAYGPGDIPTRVLKECAP